MKILLKRLFACCMAVCMVVTMCSVLFTVSAEDALADTVTVETVEYTRDPADLEPSVEVPVKVLAAKTGLKAVQVWLEVAEGLTATGVKLAATENLDKLTLTYADADDANVVLDSIEGYTSAVAPKVYENGQISVLVESDELIKTEFEIVITYTGEFTADSYTIAVADGTQAGYAKDQDLLDLTFVDGGITVVEGHVCTPDAAVEENRVEATCTTPGSYESVVYCSGCGEEMSRETVEIPVIPHTAGEVVIENQVNADCDTDGSYDEVVYCSVCGDELSREAKTTDALGHTEAEAVIENNVDATCTTAGSYDTVVYCTVCSEELSRVTTPVDALGHDYSYTDNGDGTHNATCANGCAGITNEAHNFVDGTCVCGAEEVTGPVVDSNLKFYRTTLAYGTSSLELNFRIANTVLALYHDVEVVVVPQKYDMTTLDLVENPTEIVKKKSELTAAGKNYMDYKYTDIQLYELGLNINYMMRAYDAEGNLVAVSSEEPLSISVASLLQEMSADSTKSAAFRTLIVDTLIVGDEVMKNVAKNYPDSNLAEVVAKGSILEGVDTSLATQTIGECNDVDNFVSYDSNFVQTNGATHQIRSSVAIGKVPYINFRVKDQKNAFDLNKLEINVKYTSKDSAGEHPYDKTFSGSDLTDGTFINCTFDEVGFHDSDKDILFTVSYDGEKKCEWTYSIETYLYGMKDSANTGAQCIALIKLGQSFRSYQGL